MDAVRNIITSQAYSVVPTTIIGPQFPSRMTGVADRFNSEFNNLIGD